MSMFVATGWDGSNPLHALAALGLLRLGARIGPGLRMSWLRENGAWRPAYDPVPDPHRWIDELARALGTLASVGTADPALNSRVRQLSAARKRTAKIRKEAEQRLRAQKREAGWSKADAEAHQHRVLDPIDAALRKEDSELLEAQRDLQSANGLGIAHVGDAIGVDADAFRQDGRRALELWSSATSGAILEEAADPSMLVAQWPGLACDAIQSHGKVVPTPFSFSNGSGGQYLLKDFRACAVRVTAERLRDSLTGGACATCSDATSLNWDPADQVSHALVWQDPQSREKSTDVSANALAFLGLSLVPAVPRGRELRAVGWHTAGGFVWPIWSAWLGIDSVSALMASMPLSEAPDLEAWHARGVHELRLAAKVNPDGKRNFFGPSRPLA